MPCGGTGSGVGSGAGDRSRRDSPLALPAAGLDLGTFGLQAPRPLAPCHLSLHHGQELRRQFRLFPRQLRFGRLVPHAALLPLRPRPVFLLCGVVKFQDGGVVVESDPVVLLQEIDWDA